MEKGFIRTTCANCGTLITKIEVEFPSNNSGFLPVRKQCPYCGVILLVTDDHEYNETGKVK